MDKLINEFLKEYCDEVYDMPESQLDLMMDNHVCIEWKEKEYFVPENNSSYTDVDNLIYEFLTTCYGV